MFANHVSRPETSNLTANLAKAQAAWGPELQPWVTLLAQACDRTSQRAVADKLGKSSGYISRLISHTYAGSYAEAETLVRGAFGAEEVDCPLFGPVPLSSCIRERRRKHPGSNAMHLRLARTCPTCPKNGDIA